VKNKHFCTRSEESSFPYPRQLGKNANRQL